MATGQRDAGHGDTGPPPVPPLRRGRKNGCVLRARVSIFGKNARNLNCSQRSTDVSIYGGSKAEPSAVPRFLPARHNGHMSCSMNRGMILLVVAGLFSFARARAADEPPTKRNKQESATAALEQVKWRDEAKQLHDVAGRVLAEAEDGGLLVIGQDGKLWSIEGELISRSETGEEFRPLAPAKLGKQLQADLGAGFDVVVTKHYVICTSASREYARYCGALFERLYVSFHNYWKQRGFKLAEPEFPLVALIFAGEKEFAAFATKDAGADAATAKGYFSIDTNQMVLYDLTAGKSGNIEGQLALVPLNIATVIHEATHQIAFNSGVHVRKADNPLWLLEGMAMYFET